LFGGVASGLKSHAIESDPAHDAARHRQCQ
jgi:hypothetical protein